MTGPDRNTDRNCPARISAHVGKISLSIRAVQPVLVYLRGQGHDSSAFLKAQGVDPLIFRDPEVRLPHAVAVSLWQSASRLTNDLKDFTLQKGFDREPMEPWITPSGRLRLWERGSGGFPAIIGSCMTSRRRYSS
jgi:hypothetical protein